MLLIPRIDKKKTRANSRGVLNTYRRLCRLTGYCGNPHDLVNSPQYDGMPRNTSHKNGTENAMLHYVGYVHLTKDYSASQIDDALEKLPYVSKEILRLSYCCREKYTLHEIAARIVIYKHSDAGKLEEFTYSVKNIEKLKSEALIEFAEAYKNGELIVLKK